MKLSAIWKGGYFDTTYLQQYFAAEDASLNSWDYLYDYWRLDNGEYEKHYGETVRYYFADESVDLKRIVCHYICTIGFI